MHISVKIQLKNLKLVHYWFLEVRDNNIRLATALVANTLNYNHVFIFSGQLRDRTLPMLPILLQNTSLTYDQKLFLLTSNGFDRSKLLINDYVIGDPSIARASLGFSQVRNPNWIYWSLKTYLMLFVDIKLSLQIHRYFLQNYKNNITT